MPHEIRRDEWKCRHCEACLEIVACPGADKQVCIGCGACVPACPNQARELVPVERHGKVIIEVNGESRSVLENISVREALEELGIEMATCLPDRDKSYAPCGVGACWNCAVEIDGEVQRSCITKIREGMKIRSELPEDWIPLRIVSQIAPHSVAGVGTPWDIRLGRAGQFIEVCCLVAGCNFRCPQCQNWFVTHKGRHQSNTPARTATRLSFYNKEFELDRFCLSGGEITLNRPWLVQLLNELRELNPKAHLHISTNGSLLTKDYIDELVDAGLTDIRIDLKGLHIDTFMRMTGLTDSNAAQRCKENAWQAVDYIWHNYQQRVFIGIGVPYNKDLVSLEEIHDIGQELSNIAPSIQTTAITYRPAYRSQILMPELDEMNEVHNILREAGLTNSIRQTHAGFFGPDETFIPGQPF